MQEVSSLSADPEQRIMNFVRSELFERTFHEGMDLVETTVVYLDGEGRTESKQLSSLDSLTYASESMNLTTRLMRLASWLLVQKAVRDGNLAASVAAEARYRVRPFIKSSKRLSDSIGNELDPGSRIESLLAEKPAALKLSLKDDAVISSLQNSEQEEQDHQVVLPEGFLFLSEQANILFERIYHFDQCVYQQSDDLSHPVLSQVARLQSVFGHR